MLQKRTPIVIAVAALVAGAGAGAGSYAAFGTDGAKTTTVVQQTVAAGSPASSTKTMSVNGVYRAARDGVVEITVTPSGGSNKDSSPFPFGASGAQHAAARAGSNRRLRAQAGSTTPQATSLRTTMWSQTRPRSRSCSATGPSTAPRSSVPMPRPTS